MGTNNTALSEVLDAGAGNDNILDSALKKLDEDESSNDEINMDEARALLANSKDSAVDSFNGMEDNGDIFMLPSTDATVITDDAAGDDIMPG